MEDYELNKVLDWLMENAYAGRGEDYWILGAFPPDKAPDHFHIPIAPNTKIWRMAKERLITSHNRQNEK